MSIAVAYGGDCAICDRVRDADPFSDQYDAAKEWHVHVSRHGASVEVYPTKGGLTGVTNWIYARNLFHGWRERWPMLDRFNLWYPKTDAQLASGVLYCQRYCELEMAAEARARKLVREPTTRPVMDA